MMSKYSFYNPDTGQTIFVTGPSTLTRDQAQKLFDQQRASGSLINLKPGDVITSATQAADGLITAQPQALAEIKTAATLGLIGASQQAGIVYDVYRTPVTNGITVANYATQTPANESIRNIDQPQVTGVLAQVGNLTKQPAAVATNLGVGKYALTVAQLERTGYVKPGTNSLYLSQGQNSTMGVLSSPSVWTGKNGILILNDLLINTVVQDQIQQELMTQGLNQLVEIGVNVDQLPAKEQSGLALLSAIDILLAEAFLAGKATQPIPVYGPLPDDTPTDWQYPQRIFRDAAFATEFSATNVNNSLKREVDARGYRNTTNRESIDAAATRIVGNSKISPIAYGSDPVDPALVEEYNTLSDQLASLTVKLDAVLAQTTTLSNALTKEAQLKAYLTQLQQFVKTTNTSTSQEARRLVNSTLNENIGLQGKFQALVKKAEASAPVSPQFLSSLDSKLAEIKTLITEINTALQFINRVLGKR